MLCPVLIIQIRNSKDTSVELEDECPEGTSVNEGIDHALSSMSVLLLDPHWQGLCCVWFSILIM